MTTVSGIVRDTEQNAIAGASVSVVYRKPLVGFNGGAAVQNVRQFTTAGDGTLTMADLVPGHYDIDIAIVANDNTTLTVLRRGTMTVLDQATQTLQNALDTGIGPITPTELQQALNAAVSAAASATSAALSSAAAGAASGRLVVKTFAELATKIVYADPDEGQKVGAPGDVVTVLENGAPYEILASDATGADLDYTGTGGVKYEGKGAQDLRTFANVRGKINFFDLIWPSRTSEVREQIANGTFTGDLGTEWTAFRNLLGAEAAAGRRPHGVIPQCTIYTSVTPNFALDYLRLETQGNVRVINNAGGIGLEFAGTGLGTNAFGIRHMVIDPIEGSTTTGAVGYDVAWCHKSIFKRPMSLGGSFAGIRMRSCVTSIMDTPTASPQQAGWLLGNNPSIPIYVSSVQATIPTFPGGVYDMPCSWSTLINPVAEFGINACMQFDNTFGMTVLGGTAEGGLSAGLGRGFVLGTGTYYAKIWGLDCEDNYGDDILCLGAENEFHGVDSQLMFRLAGAQAFGNRIYGGKHWVISADNDTQGNVMFGGSAGTIADFSSGVKKNRFISVQKRDDNELNGADTAFEGWHDAWAAYTPTVAAVTGTLTTASATGSFLVEADGTVHFRATATITTNGTGAGAIDISLPVATTTSETFVFAGFESGVTAKTVTGRVSGPDSVARCYFVDGTYPAADGAIITISGSYRA